MFRSLLFLSFALIFYRDLAQADIRSRRSSCNDIFEIISDPQQLKPIVIVEEKDGFHVIHRNAKGLQEAVAKNRSQLDQFLAIMRQADVTEDIQKNVASQTSGPASYEKYLETQAPSPEDPNFKKVLSDPKNWNSDRARLHQELIHAQFEKTERLSAFIQKSELAKSHGDKPLLILTRGNTASGKSSTLRKGKSPLLQKLGATDFSQTLSEGSLNPDTIKAQLQAIDVGTSSNQVHEEGSMIADRLVEESFSKKLSFVVDKRFGTLASVDAIAKKAKENGYDIVLIDVDADLDSSALRLLSRKPGGADPNVSFEVVQKGFAQARRERKDIAQSSFVDEYELLSTSTTEPTLIAARRSHTEPVKIEKQQLWTDATRIDEVKIGKDEQHLAHVVDLLTSVEPDKYQIAGYLLENTPRLHFEIPRSETVMEAFVNQNRRIQAPIHFFRKGDNLDFHLGLYQEAKIPKNIFAEADRARMGQMQRLKDAVYEVRKGGYHQDHQLLAMTLREHFQTSYLDTRVTLHDLGRDSGFEIEVEGLTLSDQHRILADQNFRGRSGANGSIIFSTREIGRNPSFELVENEFVHFPGWGAGSEENPKISPVQILRKRETDRNYIEELTGTSPDKVPSIDPLLMGIEIVTPRALFDFGRAAENKVFSQGFRSDDAVSYLSGAEAMLSSAESYLRNLLHVPGAHSFAHMTRDLLQDIKSQSDVAMRFAAFSKNALDEAMSNNLAPRSYAHSKPYTSYSDYRRNLLDIHTQDHLLGTPEVAFTDFDSELKAGTHFMIRFNSQQMKKRHGQTWRPALKKELTVAAEHFEKIGQHAQALKRQAMRVERELDLALRSKLQNVQSFEKGGFAKAPVAGAGKKIAFLPGTYDPIHEGHIRAARFIADKLGVDEVVIVPNPDPDHKPGATPARLRNKMTMVRVFEEAGVNALFFDPEDLNVPTSNRALQQKMRELYPDSQLIQILGDDVYEKLLPKGKLTTDDPKLSYVVTARGPNFSNLSPAPEALKNSIQFLAGENEEALSSSQIRSEISSGGKPSPKELHPLLLKIIEDEKLYQKPVSPK